jgi:hypothetical protein
MLAMPVTVESPFLIDGKSVPISFNVRFVVETVSRGTVRKDRFEN